jgi:hypothetical protein
MAKITIDNRKGRENYYSQRNNELSPESSCNVTSYINALVCAGFSPDKFPQHKKFPQPEDRLMDFLKSDKSVQDKYRQNPLSKDYPPNEIHEVLCYGVNQWLKGSLKLPCLFTTATPSAMVEHLRKRGALIVSGNMTFSSGKQYGHMFSIVGCRYDEAEMANTLEFFIVDPYGSWVDSYLKGSDGYDVKMHLRDALKLLKPLDKTNKYVHIIGPCS